jgi:transposase
VARQRQTTETFKTLYRRRAGIEGTISEAVRDQRLRRARYIGLDQTHFQAIVTATAINLTRAIYWLHDVPLAATHQSAFAALVA